MLGPAELEARNPNLVGGDVGGGSYRLRQVVFRPLPKLSPYSTPLKGLYIGSAATFPGGAVHGVLENPRDHRGLYQPLYTVKFDLSEVSACPDQDSVWVDVHEEWLSALRPEESN